MKHITVYGFLFVLFTTNSLFAQDHINNNYYSLNSEALKFYNQRNYAPAAKLFSEAFNIAYLNYKGYGDERYESAYNSACSWSLNGQLDSAFSKLEIITRDGRLTNYGMLISDSDLIPLHKDPRWKGICKLVKENEENQNKQLDVSLAGKLRIIRSEDQRYRLKVDSLRKQGIFNSEEEKELWNTIRSKDSSDLAEVESILNKYGWLGPSKIGYLGAQTLFLVIQHASLKVQERYLPVMETAVRSGNALEKDLAFLKDRVALRKGEKQVYGTQLWIDTKTRKVYVEPVIDPDNLDSRRASVWLGPMSEYLGQFNEKWDPAEYKKILPEIESKINKRKS